MAKERSLINIEKEINVFFASDEFKELVLRHGGVQNSYAPETFTIYNNSNIEEILKEVNKKIGEIEKSIAVYVTRDLLFRQSSTGIYMEITMPDGEKVRECIGKLLVNTYGLGRNNVWIVRFYDKYVYYLTEGWYCKAKINLVSDVKRKIFNDKKREILSDCKKNVRSIKKEITQYNKKKLEIEKRKGIVQKWEYMQG